MDSKSSGGSGTRIFDHKKNYDSKEKKNTLIQLKNFHLPSIKIMDKLLLVEKFNNTTRIWNGIDIVNKFNRLVIYDAHYVNLVLWW